MTTTTPSPVRAELFGPERRATTVGLVLLISLVAFEAMGVGTAMPALVADLGAVTLYSWPFVTFLAASVLATVVGGRWSDRAGPRPPLLVGPLLFGAGLLVAGTATTVPQLLVGRMLQGLGAGALSVLPRSCLIAAVYPERVRPAVFGLISSAWVLPSLLGPPVAGLVTESLSWHWVFLGLVPLVAVALALVAPAVRRLGRPGEVPAARRGTAAARSASPSGWPHELGRATAGRRSARSSPWPRSRRSSRRCACCCRAVCSGRRAASRRSCCRAGCSRAPSSPSAPTCR